MDANGGTGSLSSGTSILSMQWSEWVGIAVGLVHGSIRNLYVVGGNAQINFGLQQNIWKITIGPGNSFSTPTIICSKTDEDFNTMEVDINPDETLLAFACNNYHGHWANHRYYLFSIVSGNLLSFDVGTDNSEGVRGVEFYTHSSSDRLLVGAGSDGLFEIDPSNPSTPYPIPGSSVYGLSQIEMGYNGYLFAGTPTTIGAIDISGNHPVLAPSHDIPTTSTFFGYGAQFIKWFLLPDQIDFEFYDNFFTRKNTALVDLMIKDNTNPNDVGMEPNPYQGPMWLSPSIIPRNTPTLGPAQTIEFQAGVTRFIYVGVVNRSCNDYPGGGTLTVNWTKASTAMLWPQDWSNTSTQLSCSNQLGLPTNPHIGGLVGQINLPSIPKNSSLYVQVPWNSVPNPDDFYSCFPSGDYKHFCFMARVDDPMDPDTWNDPLVWNDVNGSNNWAWKNISIVNDIPGIVHNEDCYSNERRQSGVVAISNPLEDNEDYRIEFVVDQQNQGLPIFEQAEIRATLDESTWNKWSDGGFVSSNLRIDREDCRQVMITGTPAYLDNLHYLSHEITLMSLSFNFVSEKVDATPEFDYHLMQRRKSNHKIIGGETYRIEKPLRYLFTADGGGEKTITSDEIIALNANTINEDAYYNWYDEAGNLIYSGESFTVDPDITTKYKLQVIAKNDGFTSYDEVIVHVKDYQIKAISPNPASTNISVEYYIKGAATVYFSVCPFNSSSSNNYLIDPTLTNASLDLSGMGTGSYYLRLIVNGKIMDEKSFVVVQ